MKKITLLFFLILLVLIAGGILITKKISLNGLNNSYQDSIVVKPFKINKSNKDTFLINWKTYTNNKYGFTFQYPTAWAYDGKDIEVVTLSGEITAIEVSFSDTTSKTTFLVSYHLPPNAITLYQYTVSQYESAQGLYAKDSKKIKIDGNDAFEAFTTIENNGKGTSLNPPIRLIVVVFLDIHQTGEFELQFKTPLPHSNIEVSNFNKLLSSFKFLISD